MIEGGADKRSGRVGAGVGVGLTVSEHDGKGGFGGLGVAVTAADEPNQGDQKNRREQ